MIRKSPKASTAYTSTVQEGIEITLIPVTLGETVTISYDGLLARSGAKQIYAHLGYGGNDSWSQVEDVPMQKTKNKWTCELLPKNGHLNFCFHDGADNWDNNAGKNWSITIHNGAI